MTSLTLTRRVHAFDVLFHFRSHPAAAVAARAVAGPASVAGLSAASEPNVSVPGTSRTREPVARVTLRARGGLGLDEDLHPVRVSVRGGDVVDVETDRVPVAGDFDRHLEGGHGGSNGKVKVLLLVRPEVGAQLYRPAVAWKLPVVALRTDLYTSTNACCLLSRR